MSKMQQEGFPLTTKSSHEGDMNNKEKQSAVEARKLTREIIGIENRTPLEVFEIMCARIKNDTAAKEIERLRTALGKIANRSDDEMRTAKTLHWDMRGIAQEALGGEK